MIDPDAVKRKAFEEYKSRCNRIVRQPLAAADIIDSINTLALPVLQYTFPVVEWSGRELDDVDVATRRILRRAGHAFQAQPVEWYYVGRKQGGRGLHSVREFHDNAIIQYQEYLDNVPPDSILAGVHAAASGITMVDRLRARAMVIREKANFDGPAEQFRYHCAEERKLPVAAKPSVQQWQKLVEDEHLDLPPTLAAIANGGIAGLTPRVEAIAFAARCEALPTAVFRNKISRVPLDTRCRCCREAPETAAHIISGCRRLCFSRYLDRHNTLARRLHYEILCHAGAHPGPRWWQHHTEARVTLPGGGWLKWDQRIPTIGRDAVPDKPDLVWFRQGSRRDIVVIEVSCPRDDRVCLVASEKEQKYTPLLRSLRQQYGCRVQFVAIVIGGTGAVPRHRSNAA